MNTTCITPLLPEILLAGMALLLLCLTSFFKQGGVVVGKVSATLTLVTLFSAFAATLCHFYAIRIAANGTPPTVICSGIFFNDPVASFFSLIILAGAFFAVLMGAGSLGRSIDTHGVSMRVEYYVLILFSTVGALLLVKSAELITFFIALEIMSLALYALCGASVAGGVAQGKRSAESALKYFILGGFGSAFLLYGMALLFGVTGSTHFTEITGAIAQSDLHLAMLALGFLLIGLLFKVGAVPFHFWVPDVYQGAPTPVTAFMACVVKTAAFGALVRFCWGIFGSGDQTQLPLLSGVLWTVALVTMVVGNLLALRQSSVKRMLAYSSIAHAGYMLCTLLVPHGAYGGMGALLYYLAVYGATTIGSFIVVDLVVAGAKDRDDGDALTLFKGLGYTRPVLAGTMALFMFALAGLPPALAGMFGKIFIFTGLVSADYTGLAVVGVLCSAVSCYYYLRVLVLMYLSSTITERNGANQVVHERAPLTSASALAACVIVLVLLSLFPDLVRTGAALAAG